MEKIERDILVCCNPMSTNLAHERTNWVIDALGLGSVPCGRLDDEDQQREDQRAMERRRTLVTISDSAKRYLVLGLKTEGRTEEHWRLYHQANEQGASKAAYAGQRMCALWGGRASTDEDQARVRARLAETPIDGVEWHQIDPPWSKTAVLRASAAASAVARLSDWRVPVHLVRWVEIKEGRRANQATYSVFIAGIGSDESARLRALATAASAIAPTGCRVQIPGNNLSKRAWRWLATFGPDNVAPTRAAELVGAPQHAFYVGSRGNDDNAHAW